ncbi:MAG: inositol monophosphatase family protein, partial [Planctomycetota bacterium]|nr:inositol monophosphatase family protein [Planctomycetota bacterium]
MPTLSDRALAVAKRVARRAGRLLHSRERDRREISFKGGKGNLVTEMDHASEKLILSSLHRSFPDHEIVAEESGRHKGKGGRWYIDPLDGTTNYAHGLPIYSVSIAFEYRGRLEVGVIYHPSLDDLWWAQRGKGAFRNRTRLKVSSTTTLGESLVCTGFPYAMKPKVHNLKYFGDFMRKTRAVRRLGSAALDLCWTAAGVYDGFWEMGLAPWDVAAGTLLCQEAGATISDFQGEAAQLEGREILVANRDLHRIMLAV